MKERSCAIHSFFVLIIKSSRQLRTASQLHALRMAYVLIGVTLYFSFVLVLPNYLVIQNFVKIRLLITCFT